MTRPSEQSERLQALVRRRLVEPAEQLCVLERTLGLGSISTALIKYLAKRVVDGLRIWKCLAQIVIDNGDICALSEFFGKFAARPYLLEFGKIVFVFHFGVIAHSNCVLGGSCAVLR